MGYFSGLENKCGFYEQDHSITSSEKQLLWRLEELEERLFDLEGRRDEGVCFSQDELRYVLAKDFFSASDVRSAIELTISDLAERHGIYLREQPEEAPIMDELTGMQISFLDLASVQAVWDQATAA